MLCLTNTVARERERAEEERRRADQERERLEVERRRTDDLVAEVRTLLAERGRSTELTREVEELRAQLDRMARPWWRRLVGLGRSWPWLREARAHRRLRSGGVLRGRKETDRAQTALLGLPWGRVGPTELDEV